MKYKRTSARQIFRFIRISISVLFAVACLVPFVDPRLLWPVAVLGLLFPVLLLLQLAIVLYWIVTRNRKPALINAVLLLAGIRQVTVLLGFHFMHAPVDSPGPASLRVISWNVFQWDEMSDLGRKDESNRLRMIDAINKEHADVLCLQEFFEPYGSRRFRSNISALDSIGFPYHYFVPNYSIWNGEARFGMAIFSRYPIADTAAIDFGKTPHAEGLISADIRVKGQTIRVFSLHMESFRTSGYIGNAQGYEKYLRVDHLAKGLETCYALRTGQAFKVSEAIRTSPFPAIVCGNLGDVPNSYAYFKVKGDLTDAFLEKGAGLGRSYRFVSPTLRLDYVFVSQSLKVTNFHRPEINYSDHFPLVADLDPGSGEAGK